MNPDRIGILTGGGDCPGLNAVIRAVVKAATRLGWETLGFLGGYEGLLSPVSYRTLDHREMGALLTAGGTVLGTTNRGRFAAKTGHGEKAQIPREVLDEAKYNFDALGLRALICVGGDGSLTIAQTLFEHGIPVVGVPKTIDNDLEATEYTVGFQTAVEIVVEALERLHTTAESHERIIVVEVMGRYAGWIALTAGLAGGAHVVLIPEIDYDPDKVLAAFHRRHGRGVSYSIVVVAEGAKPKGGTLAVEKAGDVTKQEKLGGAGQRLVELIASKTDYEVRNTVLGHVQRGGAPNAFDRELSTRFGVKAVELIAEGKFGHVTAIEGGKLVAKPISTAVKKLKLVDPAGELVRTAKGIGIELGG